MADCSYFVCWKEWALFCHLFFISSLRSSGENSCKSGFILFIVHQLAFILSSH